jgi:hypothetical protein
MTTTTNTSRPASGTEFPELRPGALVEAVPTGIKADGTPITKPIRRRLDRAPWGFDGTSIVISDGRQIDAVHADSVRIVEQAAEPVAIAHPMDLDPFAGIDGAHGDEGDEFVPMSDREADAVAGILAGLAEIEQPAKPAAEPVFPPAEPEPAISLDQFQQGVANGWWRGSVTVPPADLTQPGIASERSVVSSQVLAALSSSDRPVYGGTANPRKVARRRATNRAARRTRRANRNR